MNTTANLHAAPAAGPSSPLGQVRLGRSELVASRVTLGTMTFGEQVAERESHAILDRAVERGVTLIDAAEMYPVPPSAATYGATESIVGNWLAARGASRRAGLLIASKVAGPSRGMPWIRGGAADTSAKAIVEACDASLKRLRIDTIDLYQIHWPNRAVAGLGVIHYQPGQDTPGNASIHEQLEALGGLVKAGKLRAVGVSNESAFGVCEFVRLAEQHGLPRIATVQNPYGLTGRTLDHGLDEAMHRLDVGLLAYSPLAFGALTGKYDAKGIGDAGNPGRLSRYERFKRQRWCRPEALAAAARYNALAREHGLTPTRMALAWCYGNWRVASTIIGVTSLAQLDECLDAWGTTLSPELLAAIDKLHWETGDPAQ